VPRRFEALPRCGVVDKVLGDHLGHPLDFGGLMEGKASNPAAWPAPFTIDASRRPQLMHLGQGHYVRATEAPAELDLAS